MKLIKPYDAGLVKPIIKFGPIIIPPSFPTTPNTPTSYNLFGSDDLGNFMAIKGTDDVAVCSTLQFSSTRGIKRVDIGGNEVWTWVNGGGSPGYYYNQGFNLASDSLSNIYWAGRYSSSVMYVAKIDSTGTTVFNASMVAAITGFNGTAVHGIAYDEQDSALWVRSRDASPSMTFHQFDPTTGAYVQSKIYDTDTVGCIEYVDGHIISAGTTTNLIKKTRISDDAVIWSKNVTTDYPSNATALSSGVTMVFNLDKTVMYLIRGNTTTSLTAINVGDGTELWGINFESNPDYGSIGSVDIYGGGLCIDKNGDVYVLFRTTSSWSQVIRLDPDGNKIYASDTDFGVRISASCQGITVSEVTGTIFVGDNNGNVWTMTQT